MIYIILAIIIFILILCFSFKNKNYSSPLSDGEDGENVVSHILGETIEGIQYVVNDILFIDNGHSCQIDHVLINKFGVWVIETKNYSGQIFGNERQKEWTQVLACGKEKYKFYNPIKQNLTHIYHLSNYLKIKNIFHNIVVFLPRADITNVFALNVVTIYDLSDIINQDTHITLSKQQMENYYNKLIELKVDKPISKNEHIINIYKMQRDINLGICPRCGGKLVLRKGKNSEFYGCSNYPNCKFLKNKE